MLRIASFPWGRRPFFITPLAAQALSELLVLPQQGQEILDNLLILKVNLMDYEIGMRRGDEFAGKVALVTGGARNIGRAISRALAAGGATVMINANTSREAGEETVAMIEKAGGKAALCMGDITDPAAVAALVDETVKQFGRIDMVISNAAIRAETPFGQMSFEEWKRVISTVLDGAFPCLSGRPAPPYQGRRRLADLHRRPDRPQGCPASRACGGAKGGLAASWPRLSPTTSPNTTSR
jgi:hypothetical protein